MVADRFDDPGGYREHGPIAPYVAVYMILRDLAAHATRVQRLDNDLI